MVVRYDSLKRLEKPSLILCNPGSMCDAGYLSNVVGVLNDCEAEELIFQFNSSSELNFRVNKTIREDSEENAYIANLYHAIQNRRLVFVEDIGYFVIDNVQEGFENSIQYKDISAKSIDIELAQRTIPHIPNGTYRFKTSGSDKGIFDAILDINPAWSVGHIDSDIESKWRTFEDVDVSTNCLSFLINNIQDAYECIVLFDITLRRINVYNRTSANVTSILLTQKDVVNSINISENAENIYTSMYVSGNDDINISAVNPLGTNTIYNFSYYFDWMSEPLKEIIQSWQNDIQSYEQGYYDHSLNYAKKLDEAAGCQFEIDRLNIHRQMYDRCRDNIVAEASTVLVPEYNKVLRENGGIEIPVSPLIDETLQAIDDLIANCDGQRDTYLSMLDTINAAMEPIKQSMKDIREYLDLNSRFTANQAEYKRELANYMFDGSYKDDYVVFTDSMNQEKRFEQMKLLYDRAKQKLDKVSTPEQEFSISTESFIFSKEFEEWSSQLETGCVINVETEEDNFVPLFLLSISINYDDHDMQLTFGNKYNKYDVQSLFDNVLGDVSKSTNNIDILKDVVYPLKSGEFNDMKNELQSSRDLTVQSAISATDQSLVVDGSGLTSRRRLPNGEFDSKQMKINGKNLVFTDDAWNTCKVAIGEIILGDNETTYGINAQNIIGDLIMGNNLKILDNKGNDLLSVVDGKISASVGDYGDRITQLEQTDEALELKVTNLANKKVTSVETTTKFRFDEDGLKIQREGKEISNLVNETGILVKRGKEEVLRADNEGVNALNLTARKYLVMGNNSRFEDYEAEVGGHMEQRTACFFIGN